MVLIYWSLSGKVWDLDVGSPVHLRLIIFPLNLDRLSSLVLARWELVCMQSVYSIFLALESDTIKS